MNIHEHVVFLQGGNCEHLRVAFDSLLVDVGLLESCVRSYIISPLSYFIINPMSYKIGEKIEINCRIIFKN